jgi:hypothetical protein
MKIDRNIVECHVDTLIALNGIDCVSSVID